MGTIIRILEGSGLIMGILYAIDYAMDGDFDLYHRWWKVNWIRVFKKLARRVKK